MNQPEWWEHPVGSEQLHPQELRNQPPTDAAGPVDRDYTYTSPVLGNWVDRNPGKVGDMVNVAGAMGGLGGTIGGVKAIGAPLAKLEIAQRWQKMGLDPAKIENQTGWWLAPDGKWRHYIDNTSAQLNPKGLTEAPYGNNLLMVKDSKQYLPDVWKDPATYKAYPELKDLPVQQMPIDMMQRAQGYYAPVGLYGASGSLSSPHIGLSIAEPNKLARTISHEINHPVQHIENHSGMASSADYAKSLVEMEANADMRLWEAGQNPLMALQGLAKGKVPMTPRLESQYRMVPDWYSGQLVKESLPFKDQAVGGDWKVPPSWPSR